MQVEVFMDLIKRGFDVSFNHKDVFYTISLIYDDGLQKKYGIGSDNGFKFDFVSIEDITDFVLDDMSIRNIIQSLSEDEIFY